MFCLTGKLTSPKLDLTTAKLLSYASKYQQERLVAGYSRPFGIKEKRQERKNNEKGR